MKTQGTQQRSTTLQPDICAVVMGRWRKKQLLESSWGVGGGGGGGGTESAAHSRRESGRRETSSSCCKDKTVETQNLDTVFFLFLIYVLSCDSYGSLCFTVNGYNKRLGHVTN